MRPCKQLGLITAAAIAVVIFGGSSGASASPIDFCLGFTSTPSAATASECTAHGGTIHTESTKTTLQLKAIDPVILGTLNELCQEANSTMSTKGDGTPGITLTALTFSGSCTPCSSVQTAPPYFGTLLMDSTKYYFDLPITGTLNGCPFEVKCKFGSAAITLELVPGAEFKNNELKAEGELLKLEEGSAFICGSTATLDAKWKVTSPSAFFVFLL